MAVDQRNFGNVLDINGTEVNVEDKRLAELAGQTPKSSSQISTSSQYVPLQDTDGNIVKISPASFQEAVRNTLASLLVNNDKGTSFSQVPVIGSGDFGSASLANLASVLGAASFNSDWCGGTSDQKVYDLAFTANTVGFIVGQTSSRVFAIIFGYGYYYVIASQNGTETGNDRLELARLGNQQWRLRFVDATGLFTLYGKCTVTKVDKGSETYSMI